MARERLSTVYYPGDKITMLPEALIHHYTLGETHDCPALSLYVDVASDLRVLGTETRLEMVHIADNLRHETLEVLFNDDTLRNPAVPDYPYRRELEWLRDFAAVLEAGRGKADTVDRVDYNFKVDGERISIVPRKRGSPIDKVVSELMIFANAHWGGWLAENRVPGIYRAQSNGKTRMTTAPDPHVGLGVDQYAWSSSPLRRYVDLVNQRQLISPGAGQTDPVYPPRSEALFSVVREFELAYDAYNEFQRRLERYWMLRWLMQEDIQRSHRQRDPRRPGALRQPAAGDARAVGDGRRAGRRKCGWRFPASTCSTSLSTPNCWKTLAARRLTAAPPFRKIRPASHFRSAWCLPRPLSRRTLQARHAHGAGPAGIGGGARHGAVDPVRADQPAPVRRPQPADGSGAGQRQERWNRRSIPDALAQVNLAGGGNTDEDRRLKSPLPASPQNPDRQRGSCPADARGRTGTAGQGPAEPAETQRASCRAGRRRRRRRPDQPAIDASQLNQQAREMAQLQARISQQWDDYQKRPKRAFVGANVKEYAFARYVEDWVTKVERVGNVNYPEAARRQGIYGSLKLTVSIYADGRIEAVEVDRSSGSKILDAAADQDRRTRRALCRLSRRHAEKSRHSVDHPYLDLYPLRPARRHRLAETPKGRPSLILRLRPGRVIRNRPCIILEFSNNYRGFHHAYRHHPHPVHH